MGAGVYRRFALWAFREIVRRQFVASPTTAPGTSRPGRAGGARIPGLVRERDAWGRPRLRARAFDVRDVEVVAERAGISRGETSGPIGRVLARIAEAAARWWPAPVAGPRTYEAER